MKPSTTPSPSIGKSARITDYFPGVKQPGQIERSKRVQDDTSTTDTQPAKRQKTHAKSTTSTSLRTVRLDVDMDINDLKADTPKRMRKTPPSARLLDNTDGGLRDSLIDRWDFLEKGSAENNAASEHKRPRSSVSVPAPANVNNHKRKRLASSRLLDDVDGGLSDSVVGRFETPRYEEKVSSGGVEKNNNTSTHDTMDDDSEAETIRVDNSEEDMSSDRINDDDNEEDGGDDDDSEGNDSDKENVDPRARSRAPSLPPLPATPKHHGSQSETGDVTPSNQDSASPSSLLLPSPVVDLPPLPSSSSLSSPLVPEHQSTLLSPPLSP